MLPATSIRRFLSGTGSEYAIGMLQAKGAENLLDASNWTKSPYPLLTSCYVDGENSSYNGEPLNDPCRHARLKRVHWAADGTPILKMTYESEFLKENQTVTLTVKLESSGGGSSSSGNKTETTTNPDGSTTTTVTKSDGSKTETTKAPNGSSSAVNTDKNGQVSAATARRKSSRPPSPPKMAWW